jgi:hypothetical protein
MTIFSIAKLAVCGAFALGIMPMHETQAAIMPTVIELFTSQGCSSCPPADALLGELAKRSDVLALAFHVDYWDGLGWRDHFASNEATQRQYNYARVETIRRLHATGSG